MKTTLLQNLTPYDRARICGMPLMVYDDRLIRNQVPNLNTFTIKVDGCGMI